MSSFDVAIVGGGLVGLATAFRLLEARPALGVVVLEKETELASHQSGHNSGVVHTGLYYAPGSLKARLCREGKQDLEAFCAEHGIPLEHVGKLVVAITESELPRLNDLYERGVANGVPALELLAAEGIRDHEPHAVGVGALWSPTTAVVDYRLVAHAYAQEVRARGGMVLTQWEVRDIRENNGTLTLRSRNDELEARSLVACAGLWSDQLAARTGHAGRGAPRIVPFRGDYYTLGREARALVSGLIYPVPDPRYPFLGVHFTRRIDGAVWVGPNAVLAFARAGYRRRDFSLADFAGTVFYPGFRRLAAKYLRTGAGEMWRDVWKRSFVRNVQRYVPAVRSEDMTFGPSGVRAQALGRDGTLVDDFDIAASRRIIHVRNAPSPAATASLAIGRSIAAQALEQFEF